MRFEITINLGDTPIKISDDVSSMQEVFQRASSASEIFPPCCIKCNGTKLALRHRRAKSKAGKPCNYYEIVCKKGSCEWWLALGERQDGSGLYPKDWAAPYRGDKSTQSDEAPPESFNTGGY